MTFANRNTIALSDIVLENTKTKTYPNAKLNYIFVILDNDINRLNIFLYYIHKNTHILIIVILTIPSISNLI